MKAHMKSPYERGEDDGGYRIVLICLLALHNLYGWRAGPLKRVAGEITRIANEAAGDPEWPDRLKVYLNELGVEV